MRIFPTRKGSTAWMRHLIPRDRVWRLIDAKEQVLGRVAQQAAMLLLGKHKPYDDIKNMNVGDPVIIINARHFTLLGAKATKREFVHHSGYPGGLKRVPIADVMRRRPETPLRKAVYNMLPRNRLRKIWMNNLFIYLDDHHPHAAQNPELTAPAHIRLPIKLGRAPSGEEIAHWWTDQLVGYNDEDINKFVERAKEDFDLTKTSGLAELLQTDGDGDTEDRTKKDLELKGYVTAAEMALEKSAIIWPTSVER